MHALQGVDFPPNVICKIVELVGLKEHKALHRVPPPPPP